MKELHFAKSGFMADTVIWKHIMCDMINLGIVEILKVECDYLKFGVHRVLEPNSTFVTTLETQVKGYVAGCGN